jgi:UDP-2,4-diacetamido-2,4,6-trideoxy-beta-L-altropyranose hydrolase
MNAKIAIFRFEASPTIGAGHAIRSGVLADALLRRGWQCVCITDSMSYDFIHDLTRFERIDPKIFDRDPLPCDLLVIDHYGLSENYEKKNRKYAKKIWVIDDLANRPHDCDLLLDQTYGREEKEYKNLVPEDCKILIGSDYVLLREDFIKRRPNALRRRQDTNKIDRILVCFGGSDPNNYTLKALEMIKESSFKGSIDIVLGFSSNNKEEIQRYSKNLANECFFYNNANMPELTFNADLAIGASGSGVWERSCLGLPSVIMVTADNQEAVFKALQDAGKIFSLQDFLNAEEKSRFYEMSGKIIDGFGINRVLIQGLSDGLKNITLKKVTEEDKDLIFFWQSIKEVRQYARQTKLPSYQEHTQWFERRLKQIADPYWIIHEGVGPVGALSLVYDMKKSAYELSWYLEPSAQGRGLGTEAVKLAVATVNPFAICAFVKPENIASHRSLKKAGFSSTDQQNYRMEPYNANA